MGKVVFNGHDDNGDVIGDSNNNNDDKNNNKNDNSNSNKKSNKKKHKDKTDKIKDTEDISVINDNKTATISDMKQNDVFFGMLESMISPNLYRPNPALVDVSLYHYYHYYNYNYQC